MSDVRANLGMFDILDVCSNIQGHFTHEAHLFILDVCYIKMHFHPKKKPRTQIYFSDTK